jgi:mono/diheme cytochrome c family protein
MKIISVMFITVATAAILSVLFIYSGSYNMGADAHHWPLTTQLIGVLRDRSIARHSEELTVPALHESTQVLKGAGQYAAMCVGCHLAPGVKDSELRPGLYPMPPNLSRIRIDPKVAFWAIKHGVKMSAMPAWGGSHDDATIWSMVAFLQKLPTLDASQYQEIVAKAPPDEDMDMSAKH